MGLSTWTSGALIRNVQPGDGALDGVAVEDGVGEPLRCSTLTGDALVTEEGLVVGAWEDADVSEGLALWESAGLPDGDDGPGSAASAVVSSIPALIPRSSPESTAAASIAGGRIVHLLPFPHRPKTGDS